MASVIRNYKKRSGWIISYYDVQGNRRRQVVHCSKQEAEMIAVDIESKKNRIKLGFEPAMNENLIISEAVKNYLKHKQIKFNTEKRENLVYRNLIYFCGNISVRKITTIMIEEYLNKRKNEDKISEATLGIEYRTLKAFFNYLVSYEYLSESPMKKLKHPKVKEKPIRFLSIDEINKLLSVIDNADYRDLVLMYIHTGARCIEILKSNFNWDNVNFENKTINLLGKGSKYRSIPMNEITYEILYRRKFAEFKKDPFDFTYDMVYKKIKRYYKEAGIKDANIHVLRKTFGSLLVQNGVNIYTVSKLMGHSSVLVSERHYAKLLDKNLRDGIDELNKLSIK